MAALHVLLSILFITVTHGETTDSLNRTNPTHRPTEIPKPMPTAAPNDQKYYIVKADLERAHYYLKVLVTLNDLSKYPITFLADNVLKWFKVYAEHLSAVSYVASLARTVHDPALKQTERQANAKKYDPYFSSLQSLHTLHLNTEIMLMFARVIRRHLVLMGLPKIFIDTLRTAPYHFATSDIITDVHQSSLSEAKKTWYAYHNFEYMRPIASHFSTRQMFLDFNAYEYFRYRKVCDNPYVSGVNLVKSLIYPAVDNENLMELHTKNLNVSYSESLDFATTVVATLSRMMYKIALCNGVHQTNPETSSKQLFYLGRMAADVILGLFQTLFEAYEKFEVHIRCNRRPGTNYANVAYPQSNEKSIMSKEINLNEKKHIGRQEKPVFYPLSAFKFDDKSPNLGKDCVMHYQYGLGKLGVVSIDPAVYGNEKNMNRVPVYLNTTNFTLYLEGTDGAAVVLFSKTDLMENLTYEERWRLIYTGSTRVIREEPFGLTNLTITHRNSARALKSMVFHGELPVKVDFAQWRQQNKAWTTQKRCEFLKSSVFKKETFFNALEEDEKAVLMYIWEVKKPGQNLLKNLPKKSLVEYAKQASEKESQEQKKRIESNNWAKLTENFTCTYAMASDVDFLHYVWYAAYELQYKQEHIPLKYQSEKEVEMLACRTNHNIDYPMSPRYAVVDGITVLLGLQALFRVPFVEDSIGDTNFCGASESVTLSFKFDRAFVVRTKFIDPVSYIVIGNIFNESAMAKYAKQLSEANQITYNMRKVSKDETNKLGMYIGIGIGSFVGLLVLVGVVVGAAYLHRRNKLPNIKPRRREKPGKVVEGDSKRREKPGKVVEGDSRRREKPGKVVEGDSRRSDIYEEVEKLPVVDSQVNLAKLKVKSSTKLYGKLLGLRPSTSQAVDEDQTTSSETLPNKKFSKVIDYMDEDSESASDLVEAKVPSKTAVMKALEAKAKTQSKGLQQKIKGLTSQIKNTGKQGNNPLKQAKGMVQKDKEPVTPVKSLEKQGKGPLKQAKGMVQKDKEPVTPVKSLEKQGKGPLKQAKGMVQKDKEPVTPVKSLEKQGKGSLKQAKGMVQKDKEPVTPVKSLEKQGKGPLKQAKGMVQKDKEPVTPVKSLEKQGKGSLKQAKGMVQKDKEPVTPVKSSRNHDKVLLEQVKATEQKNKAPKNPEKNLVKQKTTKQTQ